MKKSLRALAYASFVLVLSSSVYAAGQEGGPPSNSGPREACRSDAQQFCKGIQPGGGRIKDCLEDHYKEISDVCYNALKNAPPVPPSGQGGGQEGEGSQHGGPQHAGPQAGGPQNGSPSNVGPSRSDDRDDNSQ